MEDSKVVHSEIYSDVRKVVTMAVRMADATVETLESMGEMMGVTMAV